MKLQQMLICNNKEDEVIFSSPDFVARKANLVLAFGEREVLESSLPFKELKKLYSEAQIVICSTSGQISNANLVENNIVSTAIEFEKSTIKIAEIDLIKNSNIQELGLIVKKELFSEDLKSVLVISEGSFVNGTELVNELGKQTNHSIPVFGGLAGDNVQFLKTIVGLNEDASEGKVVIIGFYGNEINFGFGCEGGWSDFGPEREVTLSEKNVLYKIGDRFALDIYKEYLGKYANDLPGSALYFPLSMRENKDSCPVVRTILSIDEKAKSMTFAGNIPQGSFIRLMKGNFDKLIDASYNAASESFSNHPKEPELALIVSCVGRKIVLGNRVEEEFEAVKEVSGNTLLCGFYSYGEISPIKNHKSCELHNQTMAIFTIREN
ncbi:FIST signal transduction protein [Flavobacterium alvei]|uniref:FIST signal transduction protein n=1 Tax=Flavobacterium alvei TaxID=2080416 RepID=UPI0026EEFD52|nr:FIST N-terminal domain-containing protein [Flavobacterium alvei]